MSRLLFTVGVAQVVILLITLGKSKVLSVVLGPAGFGITSTIDQTVLTVVQLGALSLPFTAIKFMARSHSQNHRAFQQTFSMFLKAVSILALTAVAVAGSLIAWAPGVFGSELNPYRGVLFIALLGAPAMIVQILFVNTLASAEMASMGSAASAFVSALLAVAAIAGVLLFGIDGMYAAMTLTGILAGWLVLHYLRQRLGLSVGGPSGNIVQELSHNPQVVSYALLLYTAMSAYSLTMLGTRYFVLSSLGEVQAGLLQAILSISLTAGALLGPMSNLYLTPLVNRQMPITAKVDAANRFASLLMVVLVGVTLPMVLFPRLTLTVLFSTQFLPAAQILILFVVWQCLFQIVNVYLQLLIGLDDVVFFTVATCLSYACAGVLFLLLIPRIGLGGAALGLIGAMVVSGCAATLRLRARFRSTINQAVWLRAGLCVGAIALTRFVFDVADESTLPGIGGRVMYALGTVLLVWLSLSRADRRLAIASLGTLAEHARRRKAAAV